ncbi:LysR family transcriptional regulator [Emcibacter sp.]|uniref:LysR family transcriptional regulator n=1 Tax=Emcibacter sp. TaxID=1979954 RepID=UPI002AA92789|nr:LysR family transcriptional regulator [Emcibacter sp.]
MLIPNGKISPYLIGNLFFFDVVCRHLSFSHAAEELNVSQAAVSQRMRQLEEQLSVQLFYRQARGVALTRAGEMLYTGCKDGFSAICNTVCELIDGKPRNELVISCPPSLAMDWLIPRLDDFYTKHPEIKLRISAEFNTPSRDFFLRNQIDIALRYEPLIYHAGMICENVIEELIVPVGPPGSHNLWNAPLLHDAEAWDGAPNSYEWSVWLQHQNLEHNVTGQEIYFNLAQLSLKASLQGQGIAMGRASIILDYLERGDLKICAGSPVKSGLWYRLISLENTGDNNTHRKFKKWFQEQLLQSRQEFEAFLKNGQK